MKRNLTTLAAILLIAAAAAPASAQKKASDSTPEYQGKDPKGSVSYCLPKTTLLLEVEAQKDVFYAGPYARYASKYLGIEVPQKDQTQYHILSVRMTPVVEADQDRRFLLNVGTAPAYTNYLALTSQGLISSIDSKFLGSDWRYPAPSEADFSEMGVTSNLTSESAVLYHKAKEGKSYNKVAVQQNLVVEKSAERRASEAADMIFALRQKRIQIVTGDTDATYSGEAMQAAISEITRLEEEYMTLFIGYSESSTQKAVFEVSPAQGEVQRYIAFRVSDIDGLVPAENITGKPVLMEIVPQVPYIKEVPVEEPADGKKKKAQPKEKPVKGEFITYRVPDMSTVKLLDGTDLLLQARVPVYQLGTETTLPVELKIKK